jgi:branched-chain amino acid aminotransferase
LVLIYVNTNIVPRPEAKISVFDSGFLLGDGVWEGIRLHNGKLAFLDAHLQRLYHGADALAIRIGLTPEQLTQKIYDTISANGMTSGVHIRLVVSRGLKVTPYQHPRANTGGASIVIIPEYKIASEDVKNRGIRLGTVSIRRGTTDTQDPRLNTLSKHNCIAACLEADRLGYDEGLMLDVNGNVSTCNSTNFFIVRDGEVWTSTGEFCLPGVTRANIHRLCEENDIPVFQKDFRLEDVHSGDEAFVTGTFAGVIPVVEVDGHLLSDGKRGDMTLRLQQLYTGLMERECPAA